MREHRNANKIVEWGLRPARYILFLGRFSPGKNCHLLIEAYASIETEVQLVLAGGGNRSDAYYQELLDHASDRVRLLQYVSGEAFEGLLTNAMPLCCPRTWRASLLPCLERWAPDFAFLQATFQKIAS